MVLEDAGRVKGFKFSKMSISCSLQNHAAAEPALFKQFMRLSNIMKWQHTGDPVLQSILPESN